MQISSINGYANSMQQNNIGFKSVYPVYYWLADGGRDFAPAKTKELSKTLHSRVIRALNKFRPRLEQLSPTGGQRISNYIGKHDRMYRENPVARSFYNFDGGFKANKFEPITYLLTGNDVAVFDQKYAKNIGIQKHNAPLVNQRPQSAELNKAIGDYVSEGLNYIKNRKKDFGTSEMPYGLHVKVEAKRGKTGQPKYEVVDMKFKPEKGKENPFVEQGYIK